MKSFWSLIFVFVALLCTQATCLQAQNPYVIIETNLGYMVIELFYDQAPVTVDNFLQYVNRGFYDYLLFHRVISGFMIQGGGYYYYGGSIYLWPADRDPIINESYNGLSNVRGTIAMARSTDPNSATSQFFINHVNKPGLDRANAADGYGYCVFGQVVDDVNSMNTVDAIASAPIMYYSKELPNLPNPLVGIYAAYVIPCERPSCSDFVLDTEINFEDFATFASQWLNNDCNSANDFCSHTDLNYDGSCDFVDLYYFIDNWLTTVYY
jgi:cyclophilin family peptidyl-prolyl cis-trans isomerase